MCKERKRHFIVEHAWRALRGILLTLVVVIWLLQDGFSGTDWFITGLCVLAHVVEPFHGFICNKIEKLLGWGSDFNDYD